MNWVKNPSNLPKLIERSLVAQLQISLSIIVQYGFKVTLFSYIFDSITRTIYLHSDPYSIIQFRQKRYPIYTAIKKFLYEVPLVFFIPLLTAHNFHCECVNNGLRDPNLVTYHCRSLHFCTVWF